MHNNISSSASAAGLRIGIVVSRYHREVTDALCRGAVDAFASAGGRTDDLVVVESPGSFELTAIARGLATLETRLGKRALDAIVAIGCLITGETAHDQHIANSVIQGLTTITTDFGIPIGFGVLTCPTLDHARARSSLSGPTPINKGTEAMIAAIETANTLRSVAAFKRFR